MAKEIDAFIEATEQLTALKQTIQKQKDTGTKLQSVYDSFGRIADEVGKLPIKLKGILDRADATALEISSACAKVETLTRAVPDIVARIENSDIGRSVAALTSEMTANRAELSKFADFSQRLEAALETQSSLQDQWHQKISTALAIQSESIVDFESRIGLGVEKLTETQDLIIKNFEAFETRQSAVNELMFNTITAVLTKQSDSELVLSKLINSVQTSHSTVLEKISLAYKEIARSTTATNESLTNVRVQEIEILNNIVAGMSDQDKVLRKIDAKKTSLF